MVAAAILSISMVAAASASAATNDAATAFQQNAGHTGFASGGTLGAPPLNLAWSQTLGGTLSYPLIANGYVYVVQTSSQSSTPLLIAVNEATGTTAWSRPLSGSSAGITYDDGAVFSQDTNGSLVAVNATTGALLWSKQLPEPFQSAAPVATGGTLYADSAWDGGYVYAISEADGSTKWKGSDYDSGNLAVDARFAYINNSYGGATIAFDRSTGVQAWTSGSPSCYGGGSVASDGARVMIGNASCGSELDAATGGLLDVNPSVGAPAIAGNDEVYLSGGSLWARNMHTGVILWSFAGDGQLNSPPLIVNNTVYDVSSRGTLFGVNLTTGAQVWTTTVGTTTGYWNVSDPTPGLAAAGGTMIVPWLGTLEAFQSAVPAPADINLQIDSGPDGPTTTNGATFTFSSTDPTAVTSCELDDGAWIACTGSASYTNVADGPHTFSVRTTDPESGATDALASQAWSVDTSTPLANIDSGPSGIQYSSSGTFAFSSSSDWAAFECSLDGSPFASCGSAGSGSFNTGNLSDGTHTFEVRASDALGHIQSTPTTQSWTIDTRPPVTTITAGPPAMTPSRSATFAFTADKSATFQCAIDDGAYGACSSPLTVTDLTVGTHTFHVYGTDTNYYYNSANPATYTWTVNPSAQPSDPSTWISSAPPSATAARTATFTFNSSASGATFVCSLDGAAAIACSSPFTATALRDGAHTFAVTSTDLQGNTDPTPAMTAWTVDTTPPHTTIDGETDVTGAVYITFHANEPSTFVCSLDFGPALPCSSPMQYTNLANGTHTFATRATDLAGNLEQSGAAITFSVTDGTSNTAAGGQASAANVVHALAKVVAKTITTSTTKALQTGLSVPISAPASGVTNVTLEYAARGKAPTRVAAATARFSKQGTKRVRLRLTPAGRRLLAAHRRQSLTVLVKFTERGGKTLTSTSRATL